MAMVRHPSSSCRNGQPSCCFLRSVILLLIFSSIPESRSLSSVQTPPRKALGRTSHVRQHEEGGSKRRQDDEAVSLDLPDLVALAQNARNRTPYSTKDMKAWYHWSSLATDAIRASLLKRLPHPISRTDFEILWFQLGVAADFGAMPSFQDAGARSGYAIDFLCRARLLGDLLFDAGNNPTWHSDLHVGVTVPEFGPTEKDDHRKRWCRNKVVIRSNNIHDGRPMLSCNMTSLGGGPGYDFISAALVATYQTGVGTIVGDYDGDTPIRLRAKVLDYEEGWSDLVSAVNIAFQEGVLGKEEGTSNKSGDIHDTSALDMSCSWGGRCDITKPLFFDIDDDPDNPNANVVDQIATTNLFTCQYCVSENHVALRGSNYVFFRELLQSMRDDAMLVLTETTTRLWPEFYDMVLDMNENGKSDYIFEIGFPCNVGRSKKGRQVLLTKRRRDSASKHNNANPENVALVESFRDMMRSHKAKLAAGHQRETRKIRGQKPR